MSFICKHCGKEYHKPECFTKIGSSFCSRKCKDNYNKNKHKTFKNNTFKIVDNYCLLNNYFKIDIEDIPRIEKLNCYISKMNTGYGCFVMNKKHILLHRWLLDCPKDLYVDHRNRDKSDNRKSNLNIVTPSKNTQNRKRQSNNKTGFIGIHKTKYGYRAGIQVAGKEIRKHFPDLIQAVKWRKKMEKELNYYKGGV